MRGYQFLENDFFDLCKTRKVRRIPMLLYIYLRGLYCFFRKPIFFRGDKIVQDHLGLNHKALYRARITLQEKGLIKFIPGKGRTLTIYQMLGTTLLPDLKVSSQSGHIKGASMDIMSTPINKIKDREKNKIGVFRGTTEEERKALKAEGIL